MASLVISTLVFFAASYFLKRYLDGIGIPKGLTRSTVIFCGAILIAYGVAALVDWLVSSPGL
jgi:hypothetical protein